MLRIREFQRLLRDMFAVLGWRFGLFLGLMGLTGLMEGVSLASVAPLLVASGVGSNGKSASRLTSLVSSVLGRLGLQPTATAIAATVVAALAVSTVLFLCQAYVGARLQTAYVYRWQQRLASAIFGARWGFFLRHRHGDLINALVTETQRLGGAFYQSGLLLTGIVHGALFLLVAAILSARTTLVIVAGGIVLFGITRPFVRRAYEQGAGMSRENAAVQSLAGELVGGAKLVKATATERRAVGLIESAADRLRQHFRDNAFDVQVIKGVFDFGAAALIAVVLVLSQSVLRSDPAVTLVVLAIFVRLMPKLAGIQYSLQTLSLSLPAVALLHALVSEAEADAEPLSTEPLPENLASGPLAISLHDVHVRHGAVAALAGVSLDIPPGSCLALVGGSGAGKSSLVDAVLGLVPVSGGRILVNGVDVSGLPLAALRARIGYMGQETVLYNASVRDNILWRRPDSQARELDDAVRLAGAEQFLSKLNGYERFVGDGGALLSGGERQRLALARAALGVPGLLILDEATSALDAETERTVTDGVAALKGRVTVIMIAHRLSSARIADTICVLEEGRVVERGTWDELMHRGGRFERLWRLQHTKDQDAHVEA